VSANILDKIVESKQQEVAAAKQRLPLRELKARVAHHQAQRSLTEAIHQPGRLSVIAELKRKSPSKGMLRERFDPVSLAQTLQEAGAAALSVLTDEPYFGGHLDILRDVQQFTEIPILRKDFLIDEYQLYESACSGADAVLLIARLLSDAQLRDYLQLARSVGLEALVEVHAAEELERALAHPVQLIGINTRDLGTFQMQPALIEQLVPKIPKEKTIVAESGLQTAEELARLARLGVHAALIGEALMRAPDPAAKLRELLQGIS
jgi:indole-3-glycerol phosphate synthase